VKRRTVKKGRGPILTKTPAFLALPFSARYTATVTLHEWVMLRASLTQTKGGILMKNPFMSMFLSAANRIAGQARAQATAATKREAAKTAKQTAKAWTNAMFPALASSRKKKRTR
jgi:hypothetical protein